MNRVFTWRQTTAHSLDSCYSAFGSYTYGPDSRKMFEEGKEEFNTVLNEACSQPYRCLVINKFERSEPECHSWIAPTKAMPSGFRFVFKH